MMEDRLLVCALEYPYVKLFCIDRRGGVWPSTSHNRQIKHTSLGMVIEICIPHHFGGRDWTPSYVDYDGR